jgi:hypothetical protein
MSKRKLIFILKITLSFIIIGAIAWFTPNNAFGYIACGFVGLVTAYFIWILPDTKNKRRI